MATDHAGLADDNGKALFMAKEDWENWTSLMREMMSLAQRGLNAATRQLGAASERFDAYVAAEANSSATDSSETEEEEDENEENDSDEENQVISGTEE